MSSVVDTRATSRAHVECGCIKRRGCERNVECDVECDLKINEVSTVKGWAGYARRGMAPVSGVSPHQMTWKRAQGGKGRFFISFDGKLFLQAGCTGSATAVGRSSGKSKSGRTSDAQACVWPHHYCSFRTCSMHIMRAPGKNMAAPWMLKRARAHNILALLNAQARELTTFVLFVMLNGCRLPFHHTRAAGRSHLLSHVAAVVRSLVCLHVRTPRSANAHASAEP